MVKKKDKHHGHRNKVDLSEIPENIKDYLHKFWFIINDESDKIQFGHVVLEKSRGYLPVVELLTGSRQVLLRRPCLGIGRDFLCLYHARTTTHPKNDKYMFVHQPEQDSDTIENMFTGLIAIFLNVDEACKAYEDLSSISSLRKFMVRMQNTYFMQTLETLEKIGFYHPTFIIIREHFKAELDYPEDNITIKRLIKASEDALYELYISPEKKPKKNKELKESNKKAERERMHRIRAFADLKNRFAKVIDNEVTGKEKMTARVFDYFISLQYVVKQQKRIGIFLSWNDCKDMTIDDLVNALFKG